MKAQVAKMTLLSLGVGLLTQLIQDWLGSYYFNEFLKANLINLLIALLAINSATMGIVLTKIRELIEEYGHGDVFHKTHAQFLLAVKEQIWLIGGAIFLLTLSMSKYTKDLQNGELFFGSAISGIFFYSMNILYDIAKGVLIIIEFNPKTDD